MTTQAATLTQPALKEWSAAVHAMLDGRQTVLLRKGGIHEKRFEVGPGLTGRFLLFPTVAHSHAERVRPEHRDLLEAAAADSTEDAVMLRAGAKVVAAVEVNRPEALEEIAPLHIWTAESVRADRLDFRPKHRLTVLVLQVSPLVEPLTAGADAGLRGLHQLGAHPRDWDDVGRAGARPGELAGDRRARPPISRLTEDAGQQPARAATSRRHRGARCGWRARAVGR